MKTLKRFVAGGLMIAVLLGLAACGQNGGEEPLDIMKAAQEKLASVKSMSYDMRMEMNMSMGGQQVESETVGKIDYISDPLVMKMDMDMNMGAMGQMSMYLYAEQIDGGYTAYISLDGQSWTKQALADESFLQQYDAQKAMDLYLNGIENFAEAGTEAVHGSDAVRYDGVISKDAMNEVMAASGAADQLAQYGISAADAAALYKDLGELPISIWIDQESSLPVKYEMDMTAVMQQLLRNMVASMGGTEEDLASMAVEKMQIAMTLSNIDAVDEIVIPKEAKDAPEGALL